MIYPFGFAILGMVVEGRIDGEGGDGMLKLLREKSVDAPYIFEAFRSCRRGEAPQLPATAALFEDCSVAADWPGPIRLWHIRTRLDCVLDSWPCMHSDGQDMGLSGGSLDMNSSV